MTNRRQFSAAYKTRLMLELISGQRSPAEMARKAHRKDSGRSEWRSQFLEQAAVVFDTPQASAESEQKIAAREPLTGTAL